ncbi:MAG: flavodoxin [Clostridia bacterium]|nr:flavodoxin [Clostridia bacterium]
MKRIISIALVFAIVFAFAACKANTNKETTANSGTASQAQTTENNGKQDTTSSSSKTLVIYFSATGTTKGVAQRIASATGGDLYEITPAEPYSDADLNWHDNSSRTTKEQNDKSARPAIANDTVKLDGYDTIYIGYPIWWGEEPRIMDTFVEAHSFEGKTVIPFCTSGGSGIGSSGKNLAQLSKSGTWLNGERLDVGISDSDLQGFINENK